jgi:hypothetical protein
MIQMEKLNFCIKFLILIIRIIMYGHIGCGYARNLISMNRNYLIMNIILQKMLETILLGIIDISY